MTTKYLLAALVRSALCLFGVMASLGLSTNGQAASSDYELYCALHPHKAYCWDRRHHARLIHPATQGEDFRLAADCDQSKDIALSISACTQLIEKNPQDGVAYFNRGVAYDGERNYERAIADYSKVIEFDPKQAPAYSHRGYAYSHEGNYPQALADYAKAAEIDPAYADTYFNLGNAHDDLKDFDRAVAEYSKAIELDPQQPDYYSDRGLAYAAIGNYERALVDFDKTIELDPNDAQAHDSRGGAYVGLGDYTRAIADFTKAIELYPGHAYAYGHRGYAKFYQGSFQEAVEDLKRSLELKDDIYPLLFLFLARSRAGESAAAELEAGAARLSSKDWPYTVTDLYLGRQQPDTILAATANDTERCQAKFYIGEWLLLQKRPSEAEAAFRFAAETCPKNRIEYDAAMAELKRIVP